MSNKVTLGSLEQKIMNILWNSCDPMKVRDVQDKINKDLAYTSVMTVMNRLEEKGLLKRKKIKNYYVYTACDSKDNFAKSYVKNLFQNILNSYDNLAITQFIDTVKEDEESLRILREYLDKNEE